MFSAIYLPYQSIPPILAQRPRQHACKLYHWVMLLLIDRFSRSKNQAKQIVIAKVKIILNILHVNLGVSD